MYKSVSAEQPNASAAAIDTLVAKAAEYFTRTSKYEPPKVATFPLHGMGGTGITSLTGNV
ncbi:MAG: hypothetical protein K2Y27_22000 [Xanthobacteraceae bacterium]|nr:hypothetical protein [Xanthobacteraceae bacterium]